MSRRYGLKSAETAGNLAHTLWLKELIDHGQHILHDDSLLANLNISQICQKSSIGNTQTYFSTVILTKLPNGVRITEQSTKMGGSEG